MFLDVFSNSHKVFKIMCWCFFSKFCNFLGRLKFIEITISKNNKAKKRLAVLSICITSLKYDFALSDARKLNSISSENLTTTKLIERTGDWFAFGNLG